MSDLHLLHQTLRYSHIVAGSIGLAVFWIPMFAKKGSRLHVGSGKAFTFIAYFVAATAAISCVWALAFPIAFTGITRQLTDTEIFILSGRVRFLFAILGTLMTWLVSSLQLGTYAMRTKGAHDESRFRVARFLKIAGATSVGLALFGTIQLVATRDINNTLPIALGLFGFFDARKSLSFLRNSNESSGWSIVHIESMLGAGIAFHTAFFVFGFSKVTGLQLNGVWAIIPWLIPAAVGIPATAFWTRKYR